MKFEVIEYHSRISNSKPDTVYLRIDSWNDFGFVTSFDVTYYDKNNEKKKIGAVKIGFKGQEIGADTRTYRKLPGRFKKVGDKFFSLGTDIEFYKEIAKLDKVGKKILKHLNDIVAFPEIIESIIDEKVFNDSLLRNTSLSTIKGQYTRVLNGDTELTDFSFAFKPEPKDRFSSLSLEFSVVVGSKPSTNIHTLIGRNGSGKTYILNEMIQSINESTDIVLNFRDLSRESDDGIMRKADFFSNLVSVSFSAFDTFIPPSEQLDPAKGIRYFYIGLKDTNDHKIHRGFNSLRNDCIKSLIKCFGNVQKHKRWIKAIQNLESDTNFQSMNLGNLKQKFDDLKTKIDDQHDSEEFLSSYGDIVNPLLENMSSGHTIVLLTITFLVATVEEKTLVLLDEPESHLHPPLLSAFI